MNNEQKIIKNKLGLLKLAETLGKVSEALVACGVEAVVGVALGVIVGAVVDVGGCIVDVEVGGNGAMTGMGVHEDLCKHVPRHMSH